LCPLGYAPMLLAEIEGVTRKYRPLTDIFGGADHSKGRFLADLLLRTAEKLKVGTRPATVSRERRLCGTPVFDRIRAITCDRCG
jgi:hypothetical protein